MVFRAKALWRWVMSVVGIVITPLFLFVAVFAAIHSDPEHPQTPSQKLVFSAIFLAIAAATACAPWFAWTGRLWLSDTSIKLRWRFRTSELLREQIHSYSTQGGVRMAAIRIQPPSLVLFGVDGRKLLEIPGYFEGESALRAWLDKAVAAR